MRTLDKFLCLILCSQWLTIHASHKTSFRLTQKSLLYDYKEKASWEKAAKARDKVSNLLALFLNQLPQTLMYLFLESINLADRPPALTRWTLIRV